MRPKKFFALQFSKREEDFSFFVGSLLIVMEYHKSIYRCINILISVHFFCLCRMGRALIEILSLLIQFSQKNFLRNVEVAVGVVVDM